MAKRVCKPGDISLDVAVVGGGLCGLSLARTLIQQGLEVRLFEARMRLGGRVAAGSAALRERIDLGPTWYWPSSQPLMSQLVRELGQRDFAQHDAPDVLVWSDPSERARQVRLGPVHSNARRLEGGMQSLVEALAAELPRECVQLGHVLSRVVRRSQYIELHFAGDPEPAIVLAQRVVLAMPPRLVAEQVSFEPALDAGLCRALQTTPTWMATTARVALWYEQAEWRAASHAGNAFVLHGNAVLKEIFDACEEPQTSAALGAFLALSPEARRTSQADLPGAIDAQVAQLFGLTQPATAQLTHDWAAEPYTCSQRDLSEHCAHPAHPDYGAAALQKPRWDKRLYFGASETADVEGGYMEGALRAAERIARELARRKAPDTRPSAPNASARRDRLSEFQRWLHDQRQPLLQDYQQRLAELLPSEGATQVTQRALLGSVQQLFQAALAQLRAEPQTLHGRRDAAFAPAVHAAMREFLGSAIRDALAHNQSTLALSQRSAERRPSRSYAQAILRSVYAAYRRFARAVTELFSYDGPNPARAADSGGPAAAAS